LRGDEAHLLHSLGHHHFGGLFAYPAQSNFSGVQHPLEWIALAQARGWDVLLDAAAYVPTNVLDLSQWHPDFVSLSFYKIFGYPTGIGCLLARKEKLAKLKRPWFAGGTVWGASVQGDWHVLSEGGGRYEDGTLNYLMLPAVEIGLSYIQSIGVEAIHQRVMCFTDWLLKTLASLKHQTGVPLVRIHGPITSVRRGATIAFNLLDPSGALIDERALDHRAAAHNISLRTGCFCNPGVGETAYHLVAQERANPSNISYNELMRTIGLPTFGAHRISLGIATNFADLYHFLLVLQSFLDTFPETSNLPERLSC
jgi:selenocysteine lyase/cysteine desulfurase